MCEIWGTTVCKCIMKVDITAVLIPLFGVFIAALPEDFAVCFTVLVSASRVRMVSGCLSVLIGLAEAAPLGLSTFGAHGACCIGAVAFCPIRPFFSVGSTCAFSAVFSAVIAALLATFVSARFEDAFSARFAARFYGNLAFRSVALSLC